MLIFFFPTNSKNKPKSEKRRDKNGSKKRSWKRPSFTRAALEEDLKEEDNTFQTNLSITNDIETQELDLVRTYIEMDDWDSAVKILNKLISNSKNNLIISEAQLLLKEKK